MLTLRHFRYAGGKALTLSSIAGSLAFLLLPLMACSGTPSTGASSSESAAAGQGDLLAMLPEAAKTIGFIDFRALRSSALYEYLKGDDSFADPEDFEEMIERTGIDPRTDLHTVAFASSRGLTTEIEEYGGAVVSATFQRDRVIEALADRPTSEYEGFTLHLLDDPDGGEDHDGDDSDDNHGEDHGDGDHQMDGDSIDFGGALAILDDSTIAMGDEATVRAMIDVVNGAPSARANTVLMSLLEDVDTRSEMWVVSANQGLFSDLTEEGGAAIPQIPVDRINSMILSLRAGDGLALRFRGRTDAEEDAKLLGDSLNGMLAFGKMMLQSSNPDVFAIVDRSIKAGSSGQDVTVRAQLSIEDIEKLQEFARTTMEDGPGSLPGI